MRIGERHGARMSNISLFADYYEFTMLRAYFELKLAERATFSLFVRKLPRVRNFLLACGLSDLLEDIEDWRFGEEEIGYLRSLEEFPESFLEWLRGFRFGGDIFAMREGTPFFEEEPILEVTAPIAEAQLLETLILNRIGSQTIFASKAARIVAAARGCSVSDFGARRAQGLEAAIKGARAFYIAGVASTSDVAAGSAYGLPLDGTMAHSFVEASASEREAFEGFTKIFPEATLLVDTYDTIAGVKNAIAIAKAQGGKARFRAIRLDSGDLGELASAARKLLDEAGLSDVAIVASGGLDEIAIDRLRAAGAPIDGFGVGSDMAASADAPTLDIAYKLTEYAGSPRMKLSPGKRSLPGRKQVFRQFEGGVAVRDVITLRDDAVPGQPLLHPVMLNGRRVESERFALGDIRDYARQAIAALPEDRRGLSTPASPYPVEISASLARLEEETSARLNAAVRSAAAGEAIAASASAKPAKESRLVEFRRSDAVVVVDVQRDFCRGGALAIAGADDIVPTINRLIDEATAAGATVVASRDWHPADHASFQTRGGPWPKHCVAGSEGARFHERLRLPANALLLSKGENLEKDQYSAFDGTGLTDLLRSRGTRRIVVCGLALDVCVRSTALDAARAGFEVVVLPEASRPLIPSGGEQAIAEMLHAGVRVGRDEAGDSRSTASG